MELLTNAVVLISHIPANGLADDLFLVAVAASVLAVAASAAKPVRYFDAGLALADHVRPEMWCFGGLFPMWLHRAF